MAPPAMTDTQQLITDMPEHLTVYYCPVCKVGTGDRPWHPVGRAGLIPQAQEEHDCVKVDVGALAAALVAGLEREQALEVLRRDAVFMAEIDAREASAAVLRAERAEKALGSTVHALREIADAQADELARGFANAQGGYVSTPFQWARDTARAALAAVGEGAGQ